MSIQATTPSTTALPSAPGVRTAEGQPAAPAQVQTPPPAAIVGVGAVTTASAVSAPGAAQAPTAQNDINQALNEVRDALSPVAQNLRFSIDDDTGKTVIKIIDSSTDEVIKQIPSEEIIAIAKALDKLQGLLIKQEV